MNPRPIVDFEDLELVLAAPQFLLFKHSCRCGTSARAFRQYEQFVAKLDEPPTAWLDVVTHREWAQHVASETGVAHESPQALLIRDGRVEWHASHWEITVDALRKAVGA